MSRDSFCFYMQFSIFSLLYHILLRYLKPEPINMLDISASQYPFTFEQLR